MGDLDLTRANCDSSSRTVPSIENITTYLLNISPMLRLWIDMTDSKMESNLQITGIGEVLWDVFPDRKRFGGAPANFACQAQALGTNTHMVSCVGRDQLGLQILPFLETR